MSANIKILNQNIISRKIGKLNQDKYLNIQKITNIIQKFEKKHDMHFNRKKLKMFKGKISLLFIHIHAHTYITV